MPDQSHLFQIACNLYWGCCCVYFFLKVSWNRIWWKNRLQVLYDPEINMVARDGNFYFRKTSLGTGFSACNCLFDSRNCLLASLILGAYYKLNWPKRASAVYWLLGTLLYPWKRLKEEGGELDMEALHRAGTLAKLTVDQIKTWLKVELFWWMKEQTQESWSLLLFSGAGSCYWQQEKGRIGGTGSEAAGVKSVTSGWYLLMHMIVTSSQSVNQWLAFVTSQSVRWVWNWNWNWWFLCDNHSMAKYTKGYAVWGEWTWAILLTLVCLAKLREFNIPGSILQMPAHDKTGRIYSTVNHTVTQQQYQSIEF